MYNTRDVMERYQDLRDPIRRTLSRTLIMFPLILLLSALFAGSSLAVYFATDGSCNESLKRLVLATAIAFLLDMMFISCNFFYMRRVFNQALETLKSTESDVVVEDRYLVPEIQVQHDPLDLKATYTMDTICSTCLSTAYMAAIFIIMIVVSVMGLILLYTAPATIDCDATNFQYYSRALFITILASVILRMVWCLGYISFPKMVLNIFVFEQRRWNAIAKEISENKLVAY